MPHPTSRAFVCSFRVIPVWLDWRNIARPLKSAMNNRARFRLASFSISVDLHVNAAGTDAAISSLHRSADSICRHYTDRRSLGENDRTSSSIEREANVTPLRCREYASSVLRYVYENISGVMSYMEYLINRLTRICLAQSSCWEQETCGRWTDIYAVYETAWLSYLCNS